MSLAVVYSRAPDGIDAPLVTCEVHLSGGLPSTSIVGLPETAVKEARDRVRAAIINAHLDYPQRRVTVSLAPADLPKDGGRFDLPIALGILAANSLLPRPALHDCEFIGELALSGELRAVRGVLPAVLQATRVSPVSHIGKVFFTLGGVDYVCSANSVTSANGNTVSTAGHCLNEGPGELTDPKQQARMTRFTRDMVRHLRGQDITSGRPR